MKNTEATRTIEEVIEALRTQEHVESVTRLGHRVRVVFPRLRGGVGYHTLPQTRELLDRLEGKS